LPGKILAFLLLLFGVGATLSVLYKSLIAILKPSFQKKPEQRLIGNQLNRSHNNLKLYNRTEENRKSGNVEENCKSGNVMECEKEWNRKTKEKR